MMTSTFRSASQAVLLALACTGTPSLAAQGTLRGRVIDSEMGNPIVGAVVRIGTDGLSFTTDSSGRFQASGLPNGTLDIRITAIGYDSTAFAVRMRDSATVAGDFPIDFNGYQLPPVVVQARAEALMPRYADFERRRQRKLGAYLRWDEIKKQGFNTVGEALRSIRGVRIECNQAQFECAAVMVRTPQCHPQWYIDGIEVHSFDESTPIRDVYGIEVYRGPGETPGEYTGSNAACGVIVVWTKSKPYR